MKKFLVVWNEPKFPASAPSQRAFVYSLHDVAAVIAQESKVVADNLMVPYEDCRRIVQADADANAWLYSAAVGDFFVWREAVIVRVNSQAEQRVSVR